MNKNFLDCGTTPLGLYPIVENVDWLKRLLPLGVKTIQLRIKNNPEIYSSDLKELDRRRQGELPEHIRSYVRTTNRRSLTSMSPRHSVLPEHPVENDPRTSKTMDIENEIQQGILLARQYDTRLFINDYWELAIRYGAYGVHLGQEDLNDADLEKIRHAGLRLGISTHCLEEVVRAKNIQPSYIACGPIFHTTTKVMSCAPQGIEQLKYWQSILDYPLVAIGGITQKNIEDVLKTNVNGIALITAITKSDDPEKAAQELLTTVNQYQSCLALTKSTNTPDKLN